MHSVQLPLRAADAILALLTILVSAPYVAAGPYNIVPIHVTSQPRDISPPLVTLDDAGYVYYGQNPLSNTSILRSQGIDGDTEIVLPEADFEIGKPLRSNSKGDLAFTAYVGSQATVYRLVQGDLQPIMDVTGLGVTDAVINDNLDVAILTSVGIYTSNAIDNPIGDIPVDWSYSHNIAISNAGQIPFVVGNFGDSSVRIGSLDGTETRIADTTQFPNFALGVDINNHGTVLFGAISPEFVPTLYTWNEGALNVVFQSYAWATSPDVKVAINDSGTVIFEATTDENIRGIFTGNDPTKDFVLRVGDPLAGSTVNTIWFDGNLNNAGQIAFYAQLADGRAGIFRADPVPEPASLVLAALGMAGLALHRVRYNSRARISPRL